MFEEIPSLWTRIFAISFAPTAQGRTSQTRQRRCWQRPPDPRWGGSGTLSSRARSKAALKNGNAVMTRLLSVKNIGNSHGSRESESCVICGRHTANTDSFLVDYPEAVEAEVTTQGSSPSMSSLKPLSLYAAMISTIALWWQCKPAPTIKVSPSGLATGSKKSRRFVDSSRESWNESRDECYGIKRARGAPRLTLITPLRSVLARVFWKSADASVSLATGISRL